jgi:hypothetical protein
MPVVDDVVRPRWPSEPPRSAGPGGLLQIRGNAVARAMPSGALARAAWRGEDVHLRADSETPEAAEDALARMRFVLALDDDLEPFHRAFRADPLLGRAIRARPKLRVLRKPDPFEALTNAICSPARTAGVIPTVRGSRRRRTRSTTPPRSSAPASRRSAPARWRASPAPWRAG